MKLPKNIYERAGVLYVEMSVGGKRIKRTTGLIGATKENVASAVKVRDKIKREVLEGTYQINEQRRAPKKRSCGTIAELCSEYARICGRMGIPQPSTIKDNVRTLIVLFKYIGVDEEACLARPVDAINRVLVVDYTEAAQAALGRDNLSTGITINSAIRKVRSIFKASILAELPARLVPEDVTGFMSQFSCRNTYREIQQLTVPPTDEEMRPLIEEVKGMGPGNPLLPVWLLSFHLGMRRGEIRACRWDWFVPGADGVVQLRLVRQADVESGRRVVKTSRIIPVHPDVWAALLSTRRAGQAYVVPGAHESARVRLVDRLF